MLQDEITVEDRGSVEGFNVIQTDHSTSKASVPVDILDSRYKVEASRHDLSAWYGKLITPDNLLEDWSKSKCEDAGQ